MISAMAKELEMRQNELENKTLKSLYFGGGTPSLLKVDDLKFLIDGVLKYHNFDENIEITLEANPDDLSQNFLKELSKTEFNRLSIGTQSFYEPDLKMMNRAHNSIEAESSIKRAQDFGFENISIDLIYGSPTSNLEIWKQNLQKTLDLQVPHISSYALTVEPKTALQQWVLTNKISAPKESEQNEEFYFMSSFLKENGFQHYEISNFAKPGFQSKHNSAYWQYQEYLGVGPSAHSYNGYTKRSWNVANNQKYIQQISQNILPNETEILTEKEKYNEMLMIGLRTNLGVDYLKLKSKIDEELFQKAQISIQQKLSNGFLVLENNFLKIPEEHWFLADGIASDLFHI